MKITLNPVNMSLNKFIPLSIPNLVGNEWKYIKECLDTNWISSVGSYVNRFEENLADYVSTKHSVATSSGTAALQVALKVVGVKENDYVIVPNLTFVASANSVIYNNADPIFVDVDENNWQLDLELLSVFLKEKTKTINGETFLKQDGRCIKAIMPVHMFGNMCDMNRLMDISKKYNIVVIEDATEALGSTYFKKNAGSIGHISCFSFNGNKIITTGGGGMIMTDNELWAKHAKHLTTQAKANPFEYIHDEIGFNYRLVNILAALGVAQLESLPSFVLRKQEIAKYYYSQLKGVGDIKFMQICKGVVSNQWLFTLLTHRQKELFEKCQKNNIQVRSIWTPMNQLKMYKEHQYISDIDSSRKIHEISVSLPCSSGITNKELEHVADVVKSIY